MADTGKEGRVLLLLLLYFIVLLHICLKAGGLALGKSSCLVQAPYTSHSIVSVYSPDAGHLSIVETILREKCQVRIFDGDVAHAGTLNHFIVTKKQLDALRENSALIGPVNVDVESVSKFVEQLPKQSSGYKQRRKNAASFTNGGALLTARLDESFYSDYHVYDDLVARIQELAAANPGHVELLTIGLSFEGREIIALRMGNTSYMDPKRVLFNGVQHAREWIASMVPLYIAEGLVAELASGSGAVYDALQEMEFTIIPVVNPDGYVYTHTTDRFWRKNRRTGTGCDAGGIDLNRNWPVDFAGGESTTDDPCSNVYHGASPNSEPETLAVRRYVDARGGYVAHIDYHSYGQLILAAWAHTSADPPNVADSKKLGGMLHDALYAPYSTDYKFGRAGDLLYLASGTMRDWSTSIGAVGYTLELRPNPVNRSLEGFDLDSQFILPTCKENWEGVKAVMAYVLDKPLADFGISSNS